MNEEMVDNYTEIIIEMRPRYNNFTHEDKQIIRAIAKELGIKMGYCKRCYTDAYLEIRNALNIKEEHTSQSIGKYIFYGPKSTWTGPCGKIILDQNTSEYYIEKFMQMCPGQKIYGKETIDDMLLL